jgi:hypothetical protein
MLAGLRFSTINVFHTKSLGVLLAILPNFNFIVLVHCRLVLRKFEEREKQKVRFWVFRAVTMNSNLFWDVTPCRLADVYSCLEERY